MGKPDRSIALRKANSRPNGPGRPRSQAADQAILRAALKVFIERGIDAASIEQIADYAGVARTTLYRRWSSKEALIAQAIIFARGEPERWAVDQAKLSRLPDPLIDALADIVTKPDYKKLAARLIGSLPNCPELMAVYWNNYLLPRRSAIRELLDMARDEGLLREDCDPEILLDLISGAVIHHLLVRPGKRKRSEMLAYLVEVLRELGLSSGVEGSRPKHRRARRRPAPAYNHPCDDAI
jgi:AcrR family transcriptional regulator